MSKKIVFIAAPVFLVVTTVFFLLYLNLGATGYISFSDAAKFADIARNIVTGRGFGTNFAFFKANWQNLTNSGLFPTKTLPVYPTFVAFFIKVFGISDISVVITSSFFYPLLVVATYLIGKKLWGNLVGVLAGLAVATNVNLIDYALSGASEPLFISEILLAVYLTLLRKKWANWIGALALVLMYFTRPQAFIYIAGIILLWLLLNCKKKNVFRYFTGLILLALVVDYVVLSRLADNTIFYSVLKRGGFAASVPLGKSASLPLRETMGTSQVSSLILFKKVFYNLYNFYKLLPQIASPYMWGLFVIGLFKWGKDKLENSLKMATFLMVVATFLVIAITIPFFRYLHPVTPLVYLFATATLVWIVREIVDNQWVMIKKWPIVSRLKKEALVVGICSFLIFFFVVGQTLGVIFLDSRFKAARTSRGKPPVYVQLSWILRDNTDSDDVIVTNLDTWGSWYGERKTVWFPLKPDQLNIKDSESVQFDAIYLTSYLIDDENYYMDDEWRDILFNPESHNQQFIKDNYEYIGEFNIPTFETYEKIEGRAVLFTKKK